MPKRQRPQSEGLENSDISKMSFGPLGKTIIDSLPIGILAFDADLKIVQSNPPAGQLIQLDDYIDKSLAKGTDGSERSNINWTEQLQSSISTARTLRFDGISYTADGKTKLLRIVCAPLKKVKKHPEGGIIIIEDITESVNIQRQLANAERLAIVGKLASKVAHELNNPMDGILRYINLAMRIVEQENLEKPKEYLTQCRQGLMRMVHIVSDLLEFSRSTYTPLEYAKIEQIIEDALKTMAKDTDSLNIRILRDYAPDMPRIKSGNLFQVFCNLTKNALDAMPQGGELRISTLLTDDGTIIARFHDMGTGLPVEDIDAIFEPFFTTKDKGTGLGLAICRDIIEGYGGRITAETAPEKGSIFTVYLPAGDSQERNP